MLLQPALLGGLFIGVLSALPIVNIGNCCCLWVIGGGMLAAYLDQQNDPRPITPARGAIAGLLAGMVGAVVWLIASSALDVVIAPIQDRMMAAVLRNADEMPPDARAWLEMMANRSSSPFRYVVGFVFQFFLGAIFATLGGLIGAAFFRTDAPPAIGGSPPPPPPPLPQ